VKYWEIIADNLRRAGWSWGYVSAIDSNVRTLTAFLELETAVPRLRQSYLIKVRILLSNRAAKIFRDDKTVTAFNSQGNL
jgi:hypothetical protein